MNLEAISEALTAARAFILGNETDVLFVACIVAVVSFLFGLAALIQCRTLRAELKDLRRSTQRLMSSEEKRLLKDMAGLANSKASTDEPC